MIAGRTIGIPKLTRARLDEVIRVLLTGEPVADAWATEKPHGTEIEGLNEKFRALSDNEEKGYTELCLQANYVFHLEIYRLAQSPIMMNIIETLWLQISPYFHMLSAAANCQISQRHLEELFRGIKDNEPDRAREAIHRDIADAFEILKGYS